MKIKKLSGYDVLLFDGKNLAYRHWWAQKHLKTSKGLLSGCFYGFLNSFIIYKQDYCKGHCVVVWEGAYNNRKTSSKEYKANRKPPDESLIRQLDDLLLMFTDLGVMQAWADGYEADDVIYKLARDYSREGKDVLIVSSDKDLRQCIKGRVGDEGKVHVLFPPTVSKKSSTIVDFNKALGMFEGIIHPKQIANYLALTGDSSDGISGIRGFGPKKASAFMKRVNASWNREEGMYHPPLSYYLEFFESDEDMSKYVENMKLISLPYICKQLKKEEDEVLTINETRPPNKKAVERWLTKYEIKKITVQNLIQ